MLEPGDDPVPLRSAVNLDSIESAPIAILTERLRRVADARMPESVSCWRRHRDPAPLLRVNLVSEMGHSRRVDRLLDLEADAFWVDFPDQARTTAK